MNKLTAEECREQFEFWVKSFGGEPDLTRANDEANYSDESVDIAWISWKASRQALEIALPILEQQERSEWIKWKGGNRPVAADMQVEVRFRDGKSIPSESAAYWNWHQHNSPSDIIAYRIIPERATNQNGEQ